MNIVGHRKIFYAFSAVLFLASIAAMALWGLKLGIDFVGGSLLEVEFREARPPLGELSRRIESSPLGEVRLVPTGERGLIVRSRHMSEAEHQAMLLALSGTEGLALGGVRLTAPSGSPVQEKRFDTIGPTIGAELARRSLIAIALVIILIVSYIAWAFRKVSEPVASWKYGVTTVIALVHDVLIPAGLFAIAGH
ncbi:MAG: protein translocase subunit SecF, partial [bacterium]|nr:protein translocase subunit SecF [bacterium]